MKRFLNFIIILCLILAMTGAPAPADDKELFMGITNSSITIRPNVVIMMDNSGSMNSIVFYPKKGLDELLGTADDGYNNLTAYSGNVDGFTDGTNYLSASGWYGRWIYNGNAERFTNAELENINGGNYWTGCYGEPATPTGVDFRTGSNGTNWFNQGDTVLFNSSTGVNDAIAVIESKYTEGGNTFFKLKDIQGGPITVNGGVFQKKPPTRTMRPVLVHLYGTVDLGQSVRYPRDYLEWLFIHTSAMQQAAVTHHSFYGTFDVHVTPPVTLSNCATPGNDDLAGSNPRIQALFTRIQTAREVVCRVAQTSNKIVKLGLFRFNDNEGANLVQGLTDMSDESSGLVSYKNSIWGISARTWTPLAEALADIWKYYKPGPASKTYWPVDWEIENGLVNHSTSNPVSPIEYYCQTNYVVIMTDGESTKDRFDTGYTGSIFKSKPVKRPANWTSWNDGWGDTDNTDGTNGIPTNYNVNNTYCPNYSCWSSGDGGSDYLDDVAYFIRHQDMFPDAHFGTDPDTGWPGEQNIYTYTIGFNIDNHMLLQAAINGDGAYYTANNYEDLVEAFQLIITSINLRNFAFSSITAPKKTTTATDDELTASYVGYFLPSQANSIWEGHLLAFKLDDLWGFDVDENGEVGPEEFVYATELDCATAAGGAEYCTRWLYLSLGHLWDAASKMPPDRKLYTNDTSNSNSLIEFKQANRSSLISKLSSPTYTVSDAEAEQIIEKIRAPWLADIFHSDVTFIGPPPQGKQFMKNINPIENTGDQTFSDFYNETKDREKVLYVGTNDGVLHSFFADGVKAGKEIWGFIPDEVMPSLKPIVIDSKHTYTVDGRINAEDIYYIDSGVNKWHTQLTFGLRQGGRSYYALDITSVDTEPKVSWKFIDNAHSGYSWAKTSYGRLMMTDPDDTANIIHKWVIFVPAGFAYNHEKTTDLRGKGYFVIDASNGELLYTFAYSASGEAPDGSTANGIEKYTADNIHYLTSDPAMNYPVPSSMTVIDKDGNGIMDTVYFCNVAGNVFKTDISAPNPANWVTYQIFSNPVTDKASSRITAISADILTVQNASGFSVGDTVIGKTSFAMGYITVIDQKKITVIVHEGTFQVNENLAVRTWDPIYISPTVMYDACNQLWVGFGTGERDRPRSSGNAGSFVLFKDKDNIMNTKASTLQQLTWSSDGKTLTNTTLNTGKNGFYFVYPDTGEKIFDPEIITLPDKKFNPKIYFNTYTPPAGAVAHGVNPCNAPSEGVMQLYHLTLGCGLNLTIEGEKTVGRIAGGGIYGGKEYLLYEGTDGKVASPPGGEEGDEENIQARSNKLPYSGGIVFVKEKKK